MAQCRGLRTLIMPRAKNAFGPLFQPSAAGCIKSTGNFYAPNMPGDGAKAISGSAETEFTILINFSQCVNITSPAFATLWRESGDNTTTLTAVEKVTDRTWRYTTNVPIVPGSRLVWEYESGGRAILDCKEGEDLPDQQVTLSNNLVLQGDFILLETGGVNVLLLEEDIDEEADPQEAYLTEDAP